LAREHWSKDKRGKAVKKGKSRDHWKREGIRTKQVGGKEVGDKLKEKWEKLDGRERD